MGALTETKAACPVCGHASARALFVRDGYAIHRCRDCALRFAAPRPTPSDLDAVYAKAYFDDKGWVGDPTSDSSYMTRCWREVAPLLHRRFPARGRLLDIGCATGAFIAAAARDGWNVAGIEYSVDAAARARDAGLDVRAGTLAGEPFAGETFDVVGAWHVVEHLIDPVADLRRIRSLTRPGGLLVLETPNDRSIGAKIRGERWAQIRPPEHINFFDRRALARALALAAWHVVSSRTIYKRDTAERIAGRKSLYPLARLAARASEAAGMGGNLRVIAEAR
ncbi:MAG TPA: class I SAM-dependent methyltransferase [Actinomycetota bacterium]